MTLMAAGGRTSPPKAHLLQPRATYRYAELMGRDLLSPHFGARRHPSAPTMPAQRSTSDADAIRHTVRPLVVHQRRQTPPTGAGGRRQQADRVPDPTGQLGQGSNESQTRGGMFEDRWATSHGVGTLLWAGSRSPSREWNSVDCVTQTLDGANASDASATLSFDVAAPSVQPRYRHGDWRCVMY